MHVVHRRVSACASVVWIALARNAPGPMRAATMRDLISVLRSGTRAWTLVLFSFLAFGGFVAMYLYLPKLLQRRPGPGRPRRSSGPAG